MNQEIIAGVIVVAIALLGWIFLSTSKADTFTNPITRTDERVALTREDQIELGESFREEVEAELEGAETDFSVNSRMDAITQRLLVALRELERRVPHPGGNPNHLSNFPYRFRVARDSEVINAFALPGGPIYITRGLYDKIGSDDELAAVLAHEIGHVALRHSAKAYETLMKGQLALSVLDQLLGRGTTLFDASTLAEYLLQLSFSRDRESSSDHFGYLLLCEAGFDTQGMSDLFETFVELSGSQGSINPEWSLTHPLPQSRIQYVKNLTCALP